MAPDEAELEDLVAPHRAELHAHCYRMLGSLQDADDALQDAILGAWRGLAGFEGKSSLRTWLYRVTTNACLQLIAQRPKRILSADHGPAARPDAPMGDIVTGPVWLEPYPHDPQARYEQLESVELAFVAALQHLAASQRAVLLLREVHGFSAAEAAELLGTTVVSVDGALQHARETMEERVPPKSQQATLKDLGEAAQRELVERFMRAWERADVAALLAMLAPNARFSVPPLPNWFDGRENVGRFLSVRVFTNRWRLRPLRASGQLAFACYQGPDFDLGALNVLTLRGGSIAEMTGFLDPSVHVRFVLPDR